MRKAQIDSRRMLRRQISRPPLPGIITPVRAIRNRGIV